MVARTGDTYIGPEIAHAALQVDLEGNTMSGVVMVGRTYYMIDHANPMLQLPDGNEEVSLVGRPLAWQGIADARPDVVLGEEVVSSDFERSVMDVLLVRLLGPDGSDGAQPVSFESLRTAAHDEFRDIGKPDSAYRIDRVVVALWGAIKEIIALAGEA